MGQVLVAKINASSLSCNCLIASFNMHIICAKYIKPTIAIRPLAVVKVAKYCAPLKIR